MRHELRALTSLRGIAAWLVVIYHIRRSIAGLPPEALAFFAKGYLAVDFFFLLSGFVIWLSWGERLHRERWRAVPAFLRKRIARIWPLHIIMLGSAVGLALLLIVTGHALPADYPLAELPLHVLLLQNWGFTDRLAWNDPSWSISCELAAYLLFPLLTLAIDWRRVPTVILLAVGVGLLVLLHFVMVAGGAVQLGYDIPHLGLPRCLLEFACGTTIAALWLRWRERPRAPAALSAALAIMLMLGWASGAMPETLAVPPAFAATLLTAALTSGMRGNPLENRALHYAGEISYATYLSHYMLFVMFKLALVSDARAVPPILIGLYLIMVLAASVALYHLIERPAQRWINGLGPRTRRTAAPHGVSTDTP